MSNIKREKVFKAYKLLAANLQNLDGIIQNDLDWITEDHIEDWKEQCKRFERNYEKVKEATIKILENRSK